jgi:arylsulfatase A-like enzyme
VLLEQASGRDVLHPSFTEQPILSQITGREQGEDLPYRYALRSGRWKLFRGYSSDGRVHDALFDLRDDPFELRDVWEANRALAAKLGERLEQELKLRQERGLRLRAEGDPSVRSEDPKILEELRALGYVEGR